MGGSNSEPLWRVGNHQPRNIYRDNVQVAVTVGPEDEAAELAARICKAMNDMDDPL